MAYSLTIEFANQWVKLCPCNGIAEGLFCGSRFDWELARYIPVNKYLCEQCKDNMEELDDARIRLIKPQRLLEEVWEEWAVWYDSFDQ